MQFLENDFWLSYVFICRYHHLLENHKKRRQKKFRDGYTRGKTKEKKRDSEQLYKVSDKSPCPSFLQSVLPAKAWRAIFVFRQKKKKVSYSSPDPSFKCPFLLSVLWSMTDSESLMESTWNHFPQNLEKNISNALQVPGSSHILLVGKNIGTSVLKSSLAIY